MAFGAPDEKFGEIVAAAVVPSEDIGDKESFIKDLRSHAASKLAKFKASLASDKLLCLLYILPYNKS